MGPGTTHRCSNGDKSIAAIEGFAPESLQSRELEYLQHNYISRYRGVDLKNTVFEHGIRDEFWVASGCLKHWTHDKGPYEHGDLNGLAQFGLTCSHDRMPFELRNRGVP